MKTGIIKKNNKKELIMKDDFYRHIFESLKEYAVFTTDKLGNVTSWNSGAERLVGYKRKDIISKNVEVFFTPEDIKRGLPAKERRLAQKIGKSYDEGWRIRKNGQKFWVSGIVFPFKDDSGKMIGFTKIMRDLTLERDVDTELEFQRKQYETILGNMPDVIMRIDRKMRYVFINSVVQKTTGRPAEDYLGKTIGDIQKTKEKTKYWTGKINKAFKTGKDVEAEASFDYGNGEIYYQSRIVPEYTGNKVTSVIIISKDITERRNYEDAMRLGEERLRLALDAGNIGVWDWDINKGEITWSDKVYDLHGITRDDHINTLDGFTKFIHPEDIDNVRKTIRQAVKKKIGFHCEFRIIQPTGIIRWLVTDAQMTKNRKEKKMRMFGATTDITDSKRTEINNKFLGEVSRVLSTSLDYKQTLYKIAEIAVPEMADWCTIDMIEDGEIKRLALTHKDPQKIKWAQELEKQFPQKRSPDRGTLKVISTGKPEHYPNITDEMLTASIKDPNYLELVRSIGFKSAMSVPIYANGKVAGVISFVSAELGRRYTKEDLSIAEEAANRARYAIENSYLYSESQKAVALRDDFISIASHELKTPLTSLKMYTQIIHKQLKNLDAAEPLKIISRMGGQIDKLSTLITDLLNISKLQMGKLEFNMEYFDLNETVKSVVESVQATAEKYKISINGEIPNNVWGDRDRISQVVVNFLTNAIKYSPDANKVTIKLSMKKDLVQVSVQDYGIGIDKEHLDKIFGRFYRVNKTNEKTFPGLGIGLYISADIINRHFGEIKVKSTKGIGSEFSFVIPCFKTSK